MVHNDAVSQKSTKFFVQIRFGSGVISSKLQSKVIKRFSFNNSSKIPIPKSVLFVSTGI